MLLEETSFNLCKTFSTNLEEILQSTNLTFINKRKYQVANISSSFDIEVSSFYENDEKRCCMYCWGFGLNGKAIRGRTWGEFLDVVEKLSRYYNLSPKRRLIVYVHNLSYEFQFFRKLFEWDKVFSTDTRKPVYAITKSGIEFRCSYILSGYSLEKLGENLLKYKVKKLVGDLDYSLIRHSETPLSDKEWSYLLNDICVVMAHIQEEIERLGNITYLPLTKTGYVRKTIEENCLKGKNRYSYSKLIRNLTLDIDEYAEVKRAYTGGFTHANANYVDKIISDVHSFDFSSSYPAVMVSEKYPMSRPFFVEIQSEKELLTYLSKYCCMFEVKFENIIATTPFENYISFSRCNKIENYILNNGRVVEADTLQLTVTEQDFLIIAKMYSWDNFYVGNFRCFFKDYLPKDFIETILQMYKSKTELKGVDGKEVEYMVSKNMINSCYGMCVTDPCRNENIYENDLWKVTTANIEEQIGKYNKSNTRSLYYPWGVWVTAYARRNLFKGILEFGNDYIYSDTDSIKVVNIEAHQKFIDDYNKEVLEKIKRCLDYHEIDFSMCSPKTKQGKVKPLGVWDYEGKYDRFKTLGAKRYMVEKDGKIGITIAGVNKKAGAKYLNHIYKTNDEIFNAFTEDIEFPAHYDRNGIDENGSGKLLHTYIDTHMEGEVIDYLGNKCIYNEQSGIHMENTNYTLGFDTHFRNYLLGLQMAHIIK